MVECTLFMIHCLRLNLQLRTISLVRTCRISSFCTVAWQLARLLLTRRIARSLGDSGASCSFFYRAMLCIRGICYGPVSVCVCLSVISRSSTKTAKHRITQTTPHDSPGTLVFWCQRSPPNSTGVTPYGGVKCRWGGSKSATFDI